MTTMEQMRRHRILNLTLVDLIPTLIVALIIHSYLWLYPLELDNTEQLNRTFIQYIASFIIIIITSLGLGIIIHRIVGIKSGLSAHLGLNGLPNKKIF
jgi:ABC-type multidrug transport system permease subunit